MKRFAPVYKRCRPLLGTFVQVALCGPDAGAGRELAHFAFSAIAQVAAAMSFHDAESELSRLNRHPVGDWMPIRAPLCHVLGAALELQVQSGSLFNAAVGQALVSWRLLPGVPEPVQRGHLGVPGFEVDGLRARRLLPIQIDLGGIAKGYAVDRAVEAIQQAEPAASGCVNAGGDLRAFGGEVQQVWVRSGAADAPVLRRLPLVNQAIATSTVHPSDRRSPYVDTRRGRPEIRPRTAVARADRCMLADALTKIALMAPNEAFAGQIAARYAAEVCLLP